MIKILSNPNPCTYFKVTCDRCGAVLEYQTIDVVEDKSFDILRVV